MSWLGCVSASSMKASRDGSADPDEALARFDSGMPSRRSSARTASFAV
ncbi:MAG: hypothetical protein IT179_05085 [Acidobacteria bacterium]|nr:hypothetical protein [Acidobacteriota bacterium]